LTIPVASEAYLCRLRLDALHHIDDEQHLRARGAGDASHATTNYSALNTKQNRSDWSRKRAYQID
jgi:hypothetical protein